MKDKRSARGRDVTRRTFLKTVGAGATGLALSRYAMPSTPVEATAGQAGFAHLLPGGYLSTSGAQIVSQDGTPVRLAGVNWYGADCDTMVPGGLDIRNRCDISTLIAQLGFNHVRLPFSVQAANHPYAVDNTLLAANPDLYGMTPLQVMDAVITSVGSQGLKVILDCHRSETGWSLQSNGLWYAHDVLNRAWTTDQWITTWTNLALHYGSILDPWGDPIVIGCDLRNEPANDPPEDPTAWPGNGGSRWNYGTYDRYETAGTSRNWSEAARDCANNIHAQNSNLLIFVEGIQRHAAGPNYAGQVQDYWAGGNHTGAVQGARITLNQPNKLVYSAHDYGPDAYPTRPPLWTTTPTTPAGVYQDSSAIWDSTWGNIAKGGFAPVWVGEFGTSNTSRAGQPWQYYIYWDPGDNMNGPSNVYPQGAWYSSLIQYIYDNSVKPGASYPFSMHWCYWSINGTQSRAPNRSQGAADWYGILNTTWNDSASQPMLDKLKLIM